VAYDQDSQEEVPALILLGNTSQLATINTALSDTHTYLESCIQYQPWDYCLQPTGEASGLNSEYLFYVYKES
jgi:hypothetical protein